MERAANGLRQIVLDAIRRAPAEDAPVLAWPIVCGAAVAARTRALAFSGGVLRVEVPDRAWRAELSVFAPRYVATLRQVAEVTAIEFVVAQETNSVPSESRP
jgi:hypothetical protein